MDIIASLFHLLLDVYLMGILLYGYALLLGKAKSAPGERIPVRGVYAGALLWPLLVVAGLAQVACNARVERQARRFYIDVGNLPGPQALAYMNEVWQRHKKKR
jgi:hypothetical protein